MAEVKLPPLGEDVASGIVLDVLVSPGDHVEPDQPVLRLETDKATTDVPAASAGTVREVLVHQGQEVHSGDPILRVDEEGGGASPETAKRLTEPGAHDEEAGTVEREERAAEPRREPPRAQTPEPRREPPRAKAPEPRPEPERPTLEREAGARAYEHAEREAMRREREPAGPRRLFEPVAAPPTVRRLARELGVEVSEVAGTGPGGAITEEDVKSHVRDLLDRLRRPHLPERPELPDFAAEGPVEREPLSAVRRATARSVARSWSEIPHVTQFDRADITDLEAFRKRYADEATRAGGKLTVTAILVKVCAAALQRFPDFNASLDLERAERIVKRYVHIGVAIDTPGGLLMPVLRDADRKGLVTLAAELGQMAERARARRTPSEELRGASFAITNLGGLGTTAFTPIVAWPMVAILSVGRSEVQPVWRDGRFEPRTILPLGITYDHRAVDGADAARFLRWIAETLEAPLRLTLED
jgi:pyruvate dehydrogenase E2 component (dihydrolipoamide acetyltransferase)